MNKILIFACTALAIVGCRQKEEDAIDIRTVVLRQYSETYPREVASKLSENKISAFFFDIDGDGVEEAFSSCMGTTSQMGWDWSVWQYRDGIWEEVYGVGNDGVLGANFCYWDGAKQQPRLFLEEGWHNPEGSWPAAIILTKDKRVSVVQFDVDEFYSLKGKGILKPVEIHEYDNSDNMIR